MTQEAPPGAPRWLKVSVILAAVAIGVVLVVSGVLGIEHGPRIH